VEPRIGVREALRMRGDPRLRVGDGGFQMLKFDEAI
jgi:hypothetical protein